MSASEGTSEVEDRLDRLALKDLDAIVNYYKRQSKDPSFKENSRNPTQISVSLSVSQTFPSKRSVFQEHKATTMFETIS